ncbi:MAG: cyclodeaminase/cyclohydrolase family protein [Planctomycetota bacterium]|nr:cyclodeaminase/cyclohydrolase family protein [Planctomycetota bacterium]
MVISSDSKLVDLSLRDFCERLGEGGGAPAGGSLAACLVATGAALGSMAFRSARGERPPPGGTTSSIFQAARAEELDELRDRALDLVDRDAAALGALLASPADKERRTALRGALEAPFETMEVAVTRRAAHPTSTRRSSPTAFPRRTRSGPGSRTPISSFARTSRPSTKTASPSAPR